MEIAQAEWSAFLAAFEKMAEIVSNRADPELLECFEVLDEALWDIQFASSPDVLKKLAAEALAEYMTGPTVALDLEKL